MEALQTSLACHSNDNRVVRKHMDVHVLSTSKEGPGCTSLHSWMRWPRKNQLHRMIEQSPIVFEHWRARIHPAKSPTKTPWIGKAERSDHHMTVSADGRSVELYKSMRRLPPSQRWQVEAMAKIKATPWQPKTAEPGEASRDAEISHVQCSPSTDPRRSVRTAREVAEHTRRTAVSGSRRSGTRRRRESDALWLVSSSVLLEETTRLRAMSAPQNPQRARPRERRQLHPRRWTSPGPRPNQDAISTCTWRWRNTNRRDGDHRKMPT